MSSLVWPKLCTVAGSPFDKAAARGLPTGEELVLPEPTCHVGHLSPNHSLPAGFVFHKQLTVSTRYSDGKPVDIPVSAAPD